MLLFFGLKVSAEKSADSLMRILFYMTLSFPLFAFIILSLYLSFGILIMICVSVGLFGFIMFGPLCASYIWISVSFLRFGKFSATTPSNRFLILSRSLFLLVSLHCECLMLSQKLLKMFPLFKLIFLFAVLIGWFLLFYLPDHLRILLKHCYSFFFLVFFLISLIELCFWLDLFYIF